MLQGTAKAAGRVLLSALLLASPALLAQEPGEQTGMGRGMFANMPRVQGEVTAVSGANVTLKDADGTLTTVVTTTNTRMMTGKMLPLKVTDIKVGDGALAVGQMDAATHTLHAAMLFTTDAAMVKAMKENLGKTYIAGKVLKIDLDNAQMMVERPDKVQQTIAFDESTSFRKGKGGRGEVGGMGMGAGAGAGAAPAGESITLADIKVGDNIYATGAIKNGMFTPAQVTVAPPRTPHARPAAPAEPAK